MGGGCATSAQDTFEPRCLQEALSVTLVCRYHMPRRVLFVCDPTLGFMLNLPQTIHDTVNEFSINATFGESISEGNYDPERIFLINAFYAP